MCGEMIEIVTVLIGTRSFIISSPRNGYSLFFIFQFSLWLWFYELLGIKVISSKSFGGKYAKSLVKCKIVAIDYVVSVPIIWNEAAIPFTFFFLGYSLLSCRDCVYIIEKPWSIEVELLLCVMKRKEVFTRSKTFQSES